VTLGRTKFLVLTVCVIQEANRKYWPKYTKFSRYTETTIW